MGGPVILRPDAPLRAARPWLSAEEELIQRVRLVLETRPGQLPWRPDFGCDLEPLVGQPATSGHLRELQWRVEQALARWLPELTVERCVVRVVPQDLGAEGPLPGTPTAEGAVLGLGTQADVSLQLDLSGPEGALSLHAQLTP